MSRSKSHLACAHVLLPLTQPLPLQRRRAWHPRVVACLPMHVAFPMALLHQWWQARRLGRVRLGVPCQRTSFI